MRVAGVILGALFASTLVSAINIRPRSNTAETLARTRRSPQFYQSFAPGVLNTNCDSGNCSTFITPGPVDNDKVIVAPPQEPAQTSENGGCLCNPQRSPKQFYQFFASKPITVPFDNQSNTSGTLVCTHEGEVQKCQCICSPVTIYRPRPISPPWPFTTWPFYWPFYGLYPSSPQKISTHKVKRFSQFNQNYLPGSQSQNFNCQFGGCGNIPGMQQFHGANVFNSGSSFGQNYFGGSSAMNFGRRKRRSYIEKEAPKDTSVKSTSKTMDVIVTMEKFDEPTKTAKRSAQFMQTYQPGSQSQNFNCQFGGCGNIPGMQQFHGGNVHNVGSTFGQNYFGGSSATNFAGRKKRSAQFNQNYLPGSQSQNFNCQFGGCGNIPGMQQYHGANVYNSGPAFGQNYFGGSTATNFGRRKRSEPEKETTTTTVIKPYGDLDAFLRTTELTEIDGFKECICSVGRITNHGTTVCVEKEDAAPVCRCTCSPFSIIQTPPVPTMPVVPFMMPTPYGMRKRSIDPEVNEKMPMEPTDVELSRAIMDFEEDQEDESDMSPDVAPDARSDEVVADEAVKATIIKEEERFFVDSENEDCFCPTKAGFPKMPGTVMCNMELKKTCKCTCETFTILGAYAPIILRNAPELMLGPNPQPIPLMLNRPIIDPYLRMRRSAQFYQSFNPGSSNINCGITGCVGQMTPGGVPNMGIPNQTMHMGPQMGMPMGYPYFMQHPAAYAPQMTMNPYHPQQFHPQPQPQPQAPRPSAPANNPTSGASGTIDQSMPNTANPTEVRRPIATAPHQ